MFFCRYGAVLADPQSPVRVDEVGGSVVQKVDAHGATYFTVTTPKVNGDFIGQALKVS